VRACVRARSCAMFALVVCQMYVRVLDMWGDEPSGKPVQPALALSLAIHVATILAVLKSRLCDSAPVCPARHQPGCIPGKASRGCPRPKLFSPPPRNQDQRRWVMSNERTGNFFCHFHFSSLRRHTPLEIFALISPPPLPCFRSPIFFMS